MCFDFITCSICNDTTTCGCIGNGVSSLGCKRGGCFICFDCVPDDHVIRGDDDKDTGPCPACELIDKLKLIHSKEVDDIDVFMKKIRISKANQIILWELIRQYRSNVF